MKQGELKWWIVFSIVFTAYIVLMIVAVCTGCTFAPPGGPHIACESRPMRQEQEGRFIRNRWIQSTCVPIGAPQAPQTPAGGFVPVYTAHIESTGRPIHINGQFEVSQNGADNVGIGWGIARSLAPLVNDSPVQFVNPPVMENLDSRGHHLPRQVRFVDLRPPPGRVYYHLVIYAKLMQAPGYAVAVEPEYGFLTLWSE